MPNRQLTIFIPELLLVLAKHKSLKLPALQLLLARSKAVPVPSNHADSEQMLCNLFQLTADNLPIAAITGLADGLPTQQGYWLRADPVQLHADLAAVYLLGNEHLTFDPAIIAELVAELNLFLQQDGFTLLAPQPKRWYLKLNVDPQINTSSLNTTLGKDISQYLPTGAGQTTWRKLFTEMQMLLYNSANVQKMRLQNKAVLNALWFWGGGYLPKPPTVNWRKIFSDDVLAQGLACLTNTPLIKSLSNLQTCLNEMITDGNYLLAMTQQSSAIEEETWLHALEKNWFVPLVAALRSRELTSVDLYLGTPIMYRVTKRSIRYFWKRKCGNRRVGKGA